MTWQVLALGAYINLSGVTDAQNEAHVGAFPYLDREGRGLMGFPSHAIKVVCDRSFLLLSSYLSVGKEMKVSRV